MKPAPHWPHFVSPENRYFGRRNCRNRSSLAAVDHFFWTDAYRSNGLPRFVVDDANLGDFFDDPRGLGIRTGDTLAGVRVLQEPLPVPHQATDVQLVVEDTDAALRIPVNGVRTPERALRAWSPFLVESLADLLRRGAGDVVAEDAQERDIAFGRGHNRDAGERQAFEEARGVFLIRHRTVLRPSALTALESLRQQRQHDRRHVDGRSYHAGTIATQSAGGEPTERLATPLDDAVAAAPQVDAALDGALRALARLLARQAAREIFERDCGAAWMRVNAWLQGQAPEAHLGPCSGSRGGTRDHGPRGSQERSAGTGYWEGRRKYARYSRGVIDVSCLNCRLKFANVP